MTTHTNHTTTTARDEVRAILDEPTTSGHVREYVVMVTGDLPGAKFEHEVHAEGCRHLPRLYRQGAYGRRVLATSPDEVVSVEVSAYAEVQQGWTAKDFRILPCARDL